MEVQFALIKSELGVCFEFSIHSEIIKLKLNDYNTSSALNDLVFGFYWTTWDTRNLHTIQFYVFFIERFSQLKIRVIQSWTKLRSSHHKKYVGGKFKEKLIKPFIFKWHGYLNKGGKE